MKRSELKRGSKGLRRTGIKRYTELKPGTKPLARRKPLHSVSKKQGKLNRELKALLDLYRGLHPLCERCGRRPSNDIHEILGGPLRMVARRHRSCILALCRPCHEAVQYWAKARQLALKMWSDPLGYDLLEVNAIRKTQQITQAEVDAYLPEC